MSRKMVGYMLILVGFVSIIIGICTIACNRKKTDNNLDGQKTEAINPKDTNNGYSTKDSDTSTSNNSPQSNEEKGYAFEQYVVDLLAGTEAKQKYWKITRWAGDKCTNHVYPESNKEPDIEANLSYREGDFNIAIECKYLSHLYGNGWTDAKKQVEQIQNYKNYAQKNGIPVFICIGLGGGPNKPEHMYIIPLKDLSKDQTITEDWLEKYNQPANPYRFWYDWQNQQLSLK